MSTTSRVRGTTAGLAGLLIAGTVTLAGCGGGDEKADARPDPTPSSADRSSSTSPTPSAGSGAGSSPDVPPATGKVIDTDYFTARAPEHYQVDKLGPFTITVNGAADIGIGTIDSDGDKPSLEQLARQARSRVDRLKRSPLDRTVTMGGEPAYLLLASRPYNVTSEAGLIHGAHWFYVTVDSYHGRAENLRILQSILASWQWK